MADKEKKHDKAKEAKAEDKQPKKEKKEKGDPIPKSTWIIAASIVVVGIVGGFALAQLIGPSGPPKTVQAEELPEQKKNMKKTFDELVAESAEEGLPWYYDQLEPIIANLDEPGVTRHVRTTIVLEISQEMNQEKGYLFLQDKKIIIKDFLSTFLAGLSLERVRGSRNRTRIKNEIKEHLNDLLFPESKPFITNVLMQDFSIQ